MLSCLRKKSKVRQKRRAKKQTNKQTNCYSRNSRFSKPGSWSAMPPRQRLAHPSLTEPFATPDAFECLLLQIAKREQGERKN